MARNVVERKMIMAKTITFLTAHDWKTNRQGGFHKFAEFCTGKGDSVRFISYPRSIFLTLGKSEYRSIYRFLTLFQGKKCLATSAGGELCNYYAVTMSFPRRLERYFPGSLFNFFDRLILNRYRIGCVLKKSDIIVLESTPSVLLFPWIKKIARNAKIVYRPSDPMLISPEQSRLHGAERIVLENSDLNVLVNEEGLRTYNVKCVNLISETVVISNGVSAGPYKMIHKRPSYMPDNALVVSYVGARPIDWGAIIYAARLIDAHFLIVTPHPIKRNIKKQIKLLRNITYIPGVTPGEVPSIVTNSSVIIVPNPVDMYKTCTWGVTAKYYQAMAANKPIVAFHDNINLSRYGITVTYSYRDFADGITRALKSHFQNYELNLEELEWDRICARFYDQIVK